jgi:hypothetical protein
MNALAKDAIPEGYRRDARSNLVWEKNIPQTDLLEDDLVRDKFKEILVLREQLIDFKVRLMGDIEAFVKLLGEKYDTQLGGEKAMTLSSYDGCLKIKLDRQDRVEFGPSIKVAEKLVKACIHRWVHGSDDNIRSIVEYAFRTDSEGKLRFGDVYALTKLEGIDDPEWERAMKAIKDSIRVAGTANYVRFYRREQPGDKMEYLSLDLAALKVEGAE